MKININTLANGLQHICNITQNKHPISAHIQHIFPKKTLKKIKDDNTVITVSALIISHLALPWVVEIILL